MGAGPPFHGERVLSMPGPVLGLLLAFTVDVAEADEFDLPYHPTWVIVQFQPPVIATAREAAHAAVAGAQPFWQSQFTAGLEGVEVPEGQVQAAVLTYRQQPGVLSASPSYEITALEIPNDPEFAEYCDIQDAWSGANNLSVDPVFMDFVTGNYRLNPFTSNLSPCIDVGDAGALPGDPADLDWDNNLVEQIPRDLDGNLRTKFGFVDMGAYEVTAILDD